MNTNLKTYEDTIQWILKYYQVGINSNVKLIKSL